MSTEIGHYFANAGPVDGPIRRGDCPSAIGVSLDISMPWQPDWIAYGVSYVPRWRGPIVTFRLSINKEGVPGLWVCVGRRFIPAEEWAEREAIREEG